MMTTFEEQYIPRWSQKDPGAMPSIKITKKDIKKMSCKGTTLVP